MEIRPPDNFRNAAELSPRTASSDPRSGGLHGEPVVIDLRRCSFIQPAAVLWCVVYPMLARLEGWRAERRDPGIHRVWCRAERTYDRRPNRDGRANAFYDVARCDFHSPDSVGRAGLFARSSRTIKSGTHFGTLDRRSSVSNHAKPR